MDNNLIPMPIISLIVTGKSVILLGFIVID